MSLPLNYKPNENENYMSAEQIEYFRSKLLKWKEDLQKETVFTCSCGMTLDDTAIGRKAQCVTYHVFNGPMQQFRIGLHNSRWPRLKLDTDQAGRPFESGIFDDIEQQLIHINGLQRCGNTSLKAGQGEQLAETTRTRARAWRSR